MRTNEHNEHVVQPVIPAQISLAMTALETAKGYIGQKEVPAGSNAGVFVEACLRTIGLGKGYAWCAAFVYRCVSEAAKAIGVTHRLPRTGGVMKMWNTCPPDMKKTKTAAILPGYLGVMNYGKGLGHIFFVVKVEGDTIHTIEGNTDAGGSRTGGMVCARTRSLSDKKIVGFIAYG